MTTAPNDDDLMQLWTSAPPLADPEDVIAAVQRDLRTQRRLLWASHAFGLLVLAYIGWLDWQGVFNLPGLMSGVVAIGMLSTAWKLHQARKCNPDLERMSAEARLRLALRHARAALRNARACHTGLPLSVVLGMALGPLLTIEGADAGEPAWVAALWVAAALGFIGGFVVFGLRLARRKKLEIAELERRLEDFERPL